ncbi:ROK family transcriptional regulator [Actinoplanes sp. NBRC 103695]|uniref:ROK family transcriptional regulator n=1 Tax=Actinoplanes sp. NBRC 103695 TaxID=3032202 RepID=UPI002554BF8C|nr:ROK family transcriptional regulator [Actinoplanes sp. NBRC 103695]
MKTDGSDVISSLTDVRATNLAAVLRHVRTHAPCSRTDIAAATGLNKATITSLVGELLDRRLLRETGPAGNRIGRPASLLSLEARPYAAVGISVAADHLTAVALDLDGERLLSWRRAFPGLGPSSPGPSSPGGSYSAGRAEAAVASLAGRVAAKLTGQGRRILGLAVAVPGAVADDDTVRFAPHLGWADLDLRPALEKVLRGPGYEVVVENDANLAVLAEHRFGARAGTPDLVALLGGTEVSAGMIAGGSLVRGDHGLAGRVGHLPLDPDGPACRCGRRGCLEAYAGLPALIRAGLPDAEADGPIEDYAPELARLAALAGSGDVTALAALTEAGRRLGQAVSILSDLLDPRAVVLGGTFTTLARWLVPAVEAEAKLTVSTMDPAAVATGAAALALDRLESGSLPT